MTGMTIERLAAQLADLSRNRFYGKYSGTVVDVDDPEKLGRLKARVPDLMRDEVLDWARPCVPYAGPDAGQYMIPPVGSGVWIEFEFGKLNRPVWSGCYWRKNQGTPETHDGAADDQQVKILKSETGLQVVLNDSDQSLTLSDGDGSNLAVIKSRQGKIEIKATAKVIVDAAQIELIDGAPHPVVFGDNLLQYLQQVVSIYQSHTHPGETCVGIPVTPAPPVPPMPVPTPALHSMKVKTG